MTSSDAPALVLPNPLVQPRPLTGQTPDPTSGRGYVDDSNPKRLSRRRDRWARMLTERMAMWDRVAAENYGVDQVPLTLQEQLEQELSMGTSDLESQAGIWGPETVNVRRARVAEMMRQIGVSQGTQA